MIVEDCLFCGIVAGDVEADVVHATERTVAFRDLNPQAPTHVLVVPRDHFANAAELAAGDPASLRRAGHHGGRGRHGRGPRRLPARLQHRRRGRAERVPHPPAPARRAPDDLASRVKRPTSRILLAVAAAALVVPFAAVLHGLRRRGPPGRRPRRPAPADSAARGRGPAAGRDPEGQAAAAPRRRAADDPDHAGDLHAVRTHGDRHRRLPLLPARPAGGQGRLADRQQRAARQPERRPPRHPVQGLARDGPGRRGEGRRDHRPGLDLLRRHRLRGRVRRPGRRQLAGGLGARRRRDQGRRTATASSSRPARGS